MPLGIKRSPWIRPLADSIGWKVQSLRRMFAKEGWEAPYLDEGRALKLLAKHNISTQRYQRLKTGAEPDVEAPQEVQSPTTALVLSPPPSAPKRSAWDMKLIPRLARLLPEQDPQKAKDQAKLILRLGGYLGPGWDDDERALRIFKQSGISIEGFERESGPLAKLANNHSVVIDLPPLEDMDAKQLRHVIGKMHEGVGQLQTQLEAKDDCIRQKDVQISKLQRRANSVMEILNSANVTIADEFKEDMRSDLSGAEGCIYLARNELKRPL